MHECTGSQEKPQLFSDGVDYGYGTVETNTEANISNEDQKNTCQVRLLEPAFFFYMMAIWSYLPLNEQYVYDRIEKETPGPYSEGHVPVACLKGVNNVTYAETQRENDIKAALSNYTLLFNVFETLPAIVVSLILCSWGDKHGRKLGLVVPCVGGVVKGVLYVITDVYGLSIDFLMLPNLIEGMSGSHMTVAGSAYAYVADVVPQSEITFRFAVLNGLLFAGSSVGNVAIGYMIINLGYTWSFVIMTAWYALALVYFIFILEESVHEKPDDQPTTFTQRCKEVWQVTVTAFKVYSVERPDKNAKWRLLLMLGASTLHAILVLGQVELDTLYLIGPPFCFDSVVVGYFLAFLCATSVIGPTIGTKLFQKCGVSDAVMGIVASISGAAAFFLQAWATTTLQLFMASITVLCRAIMSKDVSEHEQGAVQATVSSMNTLGDLLSVTLLLGLFSLTASSYYGATFIAIGLLCCACCLFFLLIATLFRPTKAYDEMEHGERKTLFE
ncbi:hypothetical protein CAPTEDRAFT_198750 [Capitella teleta]|uniref:Major facilitator superfamily (MFS) profile domain-containing protein n=1 Tax=Capitella teleta TaxID=283909 RepID=R7V381_CAPTE|nr:hypothetical protein CAPTEDRAFT_198750 [Capitella teleta]|eukprot:ELU12947.1 hypothetical protein CAPTEDRAFT_198750 [Capitella teleta]